MTVELHEGDVVRMPVVGEMTVTHIAETWVKYHPDGSWLVSPHEIAGAERNVTVEAEWYVDGHRCTGRFPPAVLGRCTASSIL